MASLLTALPACHQPDSKRLLGSPRLHRTTFDLWLQPFSTATKTMSCTAT